MRTFLPIAAALAMAVPAHAGHHEKAAGSQAETAMQSTLADTRRDKDRARDGFRHPAQTLEFFKVTPGMTVVDYMPGSGWYTRVLVPYLGAQGRYIGLNPAITPATPKRLVGYIGGLREKFPAKAKEWKLTGAPVEAYNTDQLTDAMNGTVDRALIFRGMHNLHRFGMMHAELSRLHALLSDDGMLGIVQHRAKPWADGVYTNGHKGYMRQKDVIGLVEAHGFALVATSEVNANPKDAADYKDGVWELPPVMRTKREALRPTGESDRMTLLFRKRT